MHRDFLAVLLDLLAGTVRRRTRRAKLCLDDSPVASPMRSRSKWPLIRTLTITGMPL
jgi:hypothetical protein